jgi:hypothetical protein
MWRFLEEIATSVNRIFLKQFLIRCRLALYSNGNGRVVGKILIRNPVSEPEGLFEMQTEEQLQGDAAATGALIVSVDDFAALEERIRLAVEVVKRERQARTAAEERAVTAEAQARMQAPLLEQLQNEINALRTERDQVRQRVERLLSQLDALEL